MKTDEKEKKMNDGGKNYIFSGSVVRRLSMPLLNKRLDAPQPGLQKVGRSAAGPAPAPRRLDREREREREHSPDHEGEKNYI